MSTPIAGIISSRATRDLAGSALPWAPTVDDPSNRPRRAFPRHSVALLLRVFATSTSRVADRLDPKCA